MLADIPVVLMLVGLAAYTVLAGADFGAGFWMILPDGGRASAEATRDHARHAMGPLWEANHVWLIFVLVVCWTAYPVAFASITSTLSVPLFIAAIGVILRGASYALRGQLDASPGRRVVECVFALSSIMTPFALGTVVGAIAAGRVLHHGALRVDDVDRHVLVAAEPVGDDGAGGRILTGAARRAAAGPAPPRRPPGRCSRWWRPAAPTRRRRAGRPVS